MVQRFNNGNGAYTCDACGVILWYGFDGLKNSDKRHYAMHSYKNAYLTGADILIEDGKAYCVECPLSPPLLP